MLHERQLVIRGNAEAELEFLDELGRPLFVPRAPVTPEVRGDHLLAPPVTQGGSLTGGGVDAHAPSAAEEATLDPASAELVAHMGNRGGWNVDALCKVMGLPANAVAAALMMLELAGAVRRDVCGSFVATGAMQRRATIRDAAPVS
jgi:predicted Rossmann fold nucleotide-binding protein DprA/Smf involved in DNA uptake